MREGDADIAELGCERDTPLPGGTATEGVEGEMAGNGMKFVKWYLIYSNQDGEILCLQELGQHKLRLTGRQGGLALNLFARH